jgi:hypothetical protein
MAAGFTLHIVPTNSTAESQVFKQRFGIFLDLAFHEFRVAAKPGFDRDWLEKPDELTRAQSHQPAGRGYPFTDKQQRFFQAHFSIGGAVMLPRRPEIVWLRSNAASQVLLWALGLGLYP